MRFLEDFFLAVFFLAVFFFLVAIVWRLPESPADFGWTFLISTVHQPKLMNGVVKEMRSVVPALKDFLFCLLF
jgi:hypothetical protein